MRGLRSRSWHGRESSAQALGLLREAAEPAVQALGQAVHDPDSHVQMMAIWALAQIGPAAANQSLRDATRDANWWVRAGAEMALREIRHLAHKTSESQTDLVLKAVEREGAYVVIEDGWANDALGG